VRLAVDPGTVRIGVARCDPRGVLATPLTVVRRGKGDLDALALLAAAEEAMEILVGLPRSLSGREGQAAVSARQFAAELAARVAPLPVRLVDLGDMEHRHRADDVVARQDPVAGDVLGR